MAGRADGSFDEAFLRISGEVIRAHPQQPECSWCATEDRAARNKSS